MGHLWNMIVMFFVRSLMAFVEAVLLFLQMIEQSN